MHCDNLHIGSVFSSKLDTDEKSDAVAEHIKLLEFVVVNSMETYCDAAYSSNPYTYSTSDRNHRCTLDYLMCMHDVAPKHNQCRRSFEIKHTHTEIMTIFRCSLLYSFLPNPINMLRIVGATLTTIYPRLANTRLTWHLSSPCRISKVFPAKQTTTHIAMCLST